MDIHGDYSNYNKVYPLVSKNEINQSNGKVTASSESKSTNDSNANVEISDTAKKLDSSRQATSGAFDAAKVADLKSAIQSGNYNISADEIATNMISAMDEE
ncbi:flagellar biosynthesis anti-sigma factor FlgM [Ligilactobacillus sp. WILCCON 0076]|uniref:Negative regulator of flagellin synthesis n=1 Tax=Ligilactobacillus ubinensis TaxID=2876789 RepID=A0A9X2FK51_9LACO|nr:flagellar biosynthesis anti-sigma factor FlgM [Ligilactobacillus ubinensis]MCP0886221.1 flagellar biosynthesis anti-sigma factor FlgM [Ligilactobacillus ubinensis]